MRRSSSSRRSSGTRRRSESSRFDQFGFAFLKRKEQKVHHRSHDYSYPQLSSVRVKELCELLSYWNGASFICKSQIERFIRMGIPPSLRGRVWKCLLNIDDLRETSDFNYQRCLSDVRGPLVDLGVSEYGILSAIATLSDTQNDLDLNQQPSSSCSEPCYSVDEVGLFRQIALDLQRSFPTHRSLMGDDPEAIEGQAKLFRVLIAFAKYNPRVGYSQGMSYIAAVLLMHLGEEEAFWALTALLNKPKYLNELFELDISKGHLQVKVFEQFLKHRKPRLFKHMDSAGVLSLHFVMPWFLSLFTSLPCWDSVLAAWDLVMLQGLPAVFRTALTIVELLEPRLLELSDEGSMLPLLLRVPVNVAQYTVLVPALWHTEVHDWELKCMKSLVMDESHHDPQRELCEKQDDASSSQIGTGNERNDPTVSSEGEKTTEKGAVGLLTRVMRTAQRYLFSRAGVEDESPQTPGMSSQRRSGRVSRRWTSAPLTRAQVRWKNQQRSLGGRVATTPVAVQASPDGGGAERSDQTLKRSAPVGRTVHRRSNHSIIHHVRSKSNRLLRNGKGTSIQTPDLPSYQLSSTHPASSMSSCPPEQRETARMALIRELSSRHQTSVPFRNVRESKLI
nr:TBC1 domain family member 8B isoform X1 [Nothobranchius furzeri]